MDSKKQTVLATTIKNCDGKTHRVEIVKGNRVTVITGNRRLNFNVGDYATCDSFNRYAFLGKITGIGLKTVTLTLDTGSRKRLDLYTFCRLNNNFNYDSCVCKNKKEYKTNMYKLWHAYDAKRDAEFRKILHV